MSKLKQIINFIETMATKVPDHLNLEVEAMIEDFDVEGYIVGNWGQKCLPYEYALELRFLLVEFLSLYNSLPRRDHYTLHNRESLIHYDKFTYWQSKCIKKISNIRSKFSECEEEPLDFYPMNPDFSILNISKKGKGGKSS